MSDYCNAFETSPVPAPGPARTWFRRTIDASAHAHGIDPDTATWR